jgi:hypothetical protein
MKKRIRKIEKRTLANRIKHLFRSEQSRKRLIYYSLIAFMIMLAILVQKWIMNSALNAD